MFDNLTVSTPALGNDSPASYGESGTQPGQAGSAVSTQYTPAPQVGVYSQPPVLGTAAAPHAAPQQAMVGSTRLIARVEPDDFVKLIAEAGPDIMVLHTAQAKSGGQRHTVERYVACINGIVFICNAASALRLPSPARVVRTTAVLCEGRPLSSDDYM